MAVGLIIRVIEKNADDRYYQKWLAEVIRGATIDSFEDYKDSFKIITPEKKEEIIDRIRRAKHGN